MGTVPRAVMAVTVAALLLFVSYKRAVMSMLFLYSDIVKTITSFIIPLKFETQLGRNDSNESSPKCNVTT